MAKRICAVFLVTVIFLSLFTFSTAAEQRDWIFIWDNSIHMENADTAPLIKDGKTYLPIDFILPFFSATYDYDDGANSITVHMPSGKEIFFDMTYGIVITSDNKNYYELIPKQDGKMYISLSFLVSQAEYILTLLPNGIMRVKTTTSSLADTDFSRLLKIMPTDTSLRNVSPTYYFVAFGLGSQTQKQLQTAQNHGVALTYFISDSDISSSAMSVCSLAISGRQFGITLSESFLSTSPSNEQIVEKVESTNTMLERLTRTKVNLVGLPYNSAYATNELSAALNDVGYALWSPNIILPEDDNTAASAATSVQLFDRIRSYIDFNCCIQVRNTSAAVTLFDKMLTYFSTNSVTVGSIYKGSKPVNFTSCVYNYYSTKEND